MTSELRVDNLKGSTTGGSISVLGEGTSATTNLQQGLAKQFSVFDQVGTTIGSNTAGDTFNTASQTDEATAVVLVSLTNNMGNTTYVGNNSPHLDRSDGNKNYPRIGGCTTCTTSSYKAVSARSHGNNDDTVMNSSLFGDLA